MVGAVRFAHAACANGTSRAAVGALGGLTASRRTCRRFPTNPTQKFTKRDERGSLILWGAVAVGRIL